MAAALSSLLMHMVALASAAPEEARSPQAAAPMDAPAQPDTAIAPAPPPAAEAADPAATAPGATAEPGATVADPMIEGRRRPGPVTELPPPVVQNNPGAVAV